MKKTKFSKVLLITLLTTALSFGAGRPLPDTAKIVPPETAALINIQDVSALQKQFEKTNFYKLYKDPAMGAFFNAFKGKWQNTLRESEDEMAKIIADVNAIPSGRLAAAFILNDKAKASGEPAILIVSQWGKDIKNISAAIDKAVKKAVDEGARREKETIRGHEIITITEKQQSPVKSQTPAREYEGNETLKPSPQRFVGISGDSEGGGNVSRHRDDDEAMPSGTAETPSAISYCLVDDAVIAADDKEALKFVLARIEGGQGQSLADNPNYQSTMAAVGPAHDIDIYVNLEQIVKAVAAQDSSGQMNIQIANFGLDNVASLGAAASLGRASGTPVAVKGLLKINGAKKGALKMLEPQSAPLQVPKFIDASSVGLNVFNINIKSAYGELFRMLAQLSPGFAAGINAPLVPGDENGQGRIELKKDVLNYLGGQVILANGIKKPFVTGADPTKILCAIAVTDRAAIEKSLAILHGSWTGGEAGSKRELFGHTICSRFTYISISCAGPTAAIVD